MKVRLPLVAALAVTALAGAAMGCNRSGAKLRDAASADLNCPPHNVHIIGASRVKDVEACGHHATYKFEDGDWIMTARDGSPVTIGAPPQPPPPAQPVRSGPPSVLPAQPAQGTPSMPPPSPPAPGQKAI